MVQLTMTPAIVRALEHLHGCGQLRENFQKTSEPSLDHPTTGNPISHGQIIAISKALGKLKETPMDIQVGSSVPYHLDELLRGAKIYIGPPKPKAEPVAIYSISREEPVNLKQTSEYKALMDRLRREEEERAYERMTKPPLPKETSQRFPNSSHATLFPAAQADIGEDDEISYADINRQMTLIINILISIVACSVAIWLAARHWSTPSRLGLSMGGSGMIGIAEVVVYAGYLRKVKEAREKGKKETEIKEIVNTWVIGGEGRMIIKDDTKLVVNAAVDTTLKKRRKIPK